MLQDNLPKYKRIKEIIIGRIKSGLYQNDIPMPSENDFIKEFQVSRDTILKALNALTAEKFIVRKRGKGTFVSSEFLRKPAQERQIALIIYHSDAPYYSRIAAGTESYAFSKGYSTILCNSFGDTERENLHIERHINSVDGFIIVPAADCNYDYGLGIKKIYEQNLPMIIISRVNNSPLTKKISSVLPDDCMGSFIGTRHLIECGYSRIKMMIQSKKLFSDYVVSERLKGFRMALTVAGMQFDDSSIIYAGGEHPDDGYYTDGYNFTKNSGGCMAPGTGILTINDSMAIGVLKGLREMGARVPEDIGICGFDDIPASSLGGIELTSVSQNMAALGEKAAELLIAKIEDSSPEQEPGFLNLPVFLKIRKTTLMRK